MDKSITTVHVGLDVHKDSIAIATADPGRDGEIRHVGTVGGDLASLDKALRKLVLRLFSLAERVTVLAAGEVVRVFPPTLTELQRQVLALLGVPASAYIACA